MSGQKGLALDFGKTPIPANILKTCGAFQNVARAITADVLTKWLAAVSRETGPGDLMANLAHALREVADEVERNAVAASA